MMPSLRYRIGELVVPAIVLLGCLLYWLHVQDARSVARRVPDAVIVFTVAMSAVVLMRALFFVPFKHVEGSEIEGKSLPFSRNNFTTRLLFVGLCIGYYAAFSLLGFNLANTIFLLFAYPLAGLSIVSTIIGTLISSSIFYGLARVMDFNVPLGPLGF